MTSHIFLMADEALRQHATNKLWICRGSGDKRREYTYAQVHACALDMASRLRERGVGDGDLVGIMAPNGPEWTVAALAIWKVNGIVAPVHVGNSEYEIQQQIEAVKPKLILTSNAKLDFHAKLEVEMSSDEERIAVERERMPEENAGEEAVRIYTSGSTGNPKMVRLSHNNITSNVKAVCAFEKMEPKDRFLALLPFSHCMGLTVTLLTPIVGGATIVTPRVLAANEVIAAMEEEKISILIAVPRLFRNLMHGLQKRFEEGSAVQKAFIGLIRLAPPALKKILNAPIRKHFGGEIKLWFSGGSRLDPEITKFFRDLGLPLRQGYGLTETSPVVCAQSPGDPIFESIGKTLQHIDARIDSPDEHGQGELVIKGPNVMLGYTDEQQTSEVISDGWFRTGDLARMDTEGNIVLTGRSKRLIVTEAGKNVYPEELEILLERFEEVKEAGVIEVDMKPAAVLAMEGEEVEGIAKTVLKQFNQKASGHNQITRFAIVEELPRTPLGKVAIKDLSAVFTENEVGR